MLGALQWACAEGGIDCDNISYGGPDYYPNSLIAHASWAFNQYYQANLIDGAVSCEFGLVAICNTNCTKCQATPNASDAALGAALTWVCGPQGIQTCEPIQPGGSNFLPNTTQAHASWAFNVYYQGYKCQPDWPSCDFGGTAEVVTC